MVTRASIIWALLAAAPALSSSISVLPNEAELSAATREWWQWVLIRVGQNSDEIKTDADRERFVSDWHPDLFDWVGDYRWNINEWAKLHGIFMAAQSEQEYEEAQFWTNPTEENIVNDTWGANGMNEDIYGLLPAFDGPYFAPYMTHVAPKWHLAVEQGNSRHGRAAIGDAMSQDNAIGLGIHSDSGWGFGPWEERLFVQKHGPTLGLDESFSIGDYVRSLLNITWNNDGSSCIRNVDMIGLYGRWVIDRQHEHQRDNGTAVDCCEWCGNTEGCAGYTYFADPTIHGRVTCMLTNATTFRSKELRNVTGGSCAGGQCTRNACASSSCSGSVAAERVPSEDFVQDPIVHAFIEFIYTTWRDAWKDLSLSTKAAAESAGRPEPATYGNIASPTPIFVMEMPWQDVAWMETGYAWTNHNTECAVVSTPGGTSLEIKTAQAAMRGIKAPTVFRCGGVRCGGVNQTGARAARTYLAESIANGASEWLMEGYNYKMTLSSQPKEEKNYATFLNSWRSAFIDRTRVADGAIMYSLPSVVWRNVGPLSHFKYPGSRDPALVENLHERDFSAVSQLLETFHAIYEVSIFDQPKFYNNSGSLDRLRNASMRAGTGYDWVILPSVDAISDVHATLLGEYVRGGGRMILINSGTQSCGNRDEELVLRKTSALADIVRDPGLGSVSIITSTKWEAFVDCKGTGCGTAREDLWSDVSAAMGTTGGTQPSVALDAASEADTAKATVNAFRHGSGPMVSVHLTNYASQSLSSLTVGVEASYFDGVAQPTARLLSLDKADAPGVALPVTVASGQLRVDIPPTSVHALILFASSEDELTCREAAAQLRVSLQASMLAYRSDALRQASIDGTDVSSFVTQWAHLRHADALLEQLHNATSTDAAFYQQLQAEMQEVDVTLQKVSQSIRAFAAANEGGHRSDVLSMCQRHGSCLRALDFNGGDDSPTGFTALQADQVYHQGAGFGFIASAANASHGDRLSFHNDLPSPLFNSGIFYSLSSTVRVDVDLSRAASPPSSLVLTVVSGWHDLGNENVSKALGINTTARNCRVSGTPFANDTCTRDRNFVANRETSAWTGFASTAVSVVLRASGSETASEAAPCMLGATGRGPGYFHTRSCRINISDAAQLAPQLSLDIVFAPDNGTSGCWSHQCGLSTFAWLANALVLQLPGADMPERVALSLAAADTASAASIRQWDWIGPFDDSDATGLDTTFPVERDLLHYWPVLLNASYIGKGGQSVRWQQYTASAAASAPYLPLSRLLPTREQNTGSVAYAIARIWADEAGPATLRTGMSGRGRVWLVNSKKRSVVLNDRLIFGLVSAENSANVTLEPGVNLVVMKTANSFAADAVAIEGTRAPMFGMESRDVPNGMGVIKGQNEWSVALAVEKSTAFK